MEITLTPDCTENLLLDMENTIRHNHKATIGRQKTRLLTMLAVDPQVETEPTRDAINLMADRFGREFIEWAKEIPELVAYNK